MILIYVNDLPKGLSNYISFFADDAKLLRKVNSQEDCKKLQEDLNKIQEWSERWKMDFNASKCHVMEIGKSSKRPSWIYKMGNSIITTVDQEKDLGIVMQDNLSPEKHINKIFGETYNMLRNIRGLSLYG